MRRDDPQFDAPVAGLGSQDNPWVVPSDRWGQGDPAYGAWCRCICGCLERSTFLFDFYPTKDRKGLLCEMCVRSEMAVESRANDPRYHPPEG